MDSDPLLSLSSSLSSFTSPSRTPPIHNNNSASITSLTTSNSDLALQPYVPWYRHPTLLAFLKSAAINFLLPFVNGIMLGFGEICANEIAFRMGWFGAKIIPAAGRNTIPLGLRSAGNADTYNRIMKPAEYQRQQQQELQDEEGRAKTLEKDMPALKALPL
ncbi:outer membrane protein TOM13-domain-containing protein [Endogone sp. FLAS-F59071]|nr:outer membrane protein TOM13-domain-containing protein [Endogone sp. FLAS-F59071]|eukprot:RUS19094.1 outer membrane protein TOM13-domain-containing protein [Endogone sp. FLAS-F59071]